VRGRHVVTGIDHMLGFPGVECPREFSHRAWRAAGVLKVPRKL